MAINPAPLALAFQPPKPDAASALLAFQSAWESAFSGATAGAAGIGSGALDPAIAAMAAGLATLYVPIGTPVSAATAITTTVTAFWATLLAASPTVFTTPPPAPIIIVPGGVPSPGLAGLPVALQSVFTSNVLVKDPAIATAALVTALTAAMVGGTILGSIPPAPPVPIPIL